MPPNFLQNLISITPFSAYKTDAKARWYFEVVSKEDVKKLAEIAKFSKESNLPILFLGSGTNDIFDFDIYEGIVVRFTFKEWKYEEGVLVVGSGALVHAVACDCFLKYNTRVLLPWVGLPGTFGGAAAGNAGCFGLEMKDILLDADICDLETGEVLTIQAKDFGFEYRNSHFKAQERYAILELRLDLTKEFPDNIWMKTSVEEMKATRQSKQPQGISCGSVFKNPPGQAAGALIDACGLKGTRIGQVEISPKHGNFFIATPGVTAQDVIMLIELAKKEVFAKHGITLEEEVKIIRNR